MATTIGELLVKLGIEMADWKRGISEATGGLEGFANKATSAGKKLSASVTAPLVGVGTAAVKMANSFELEMSRIEGLVGESAQAVDGMKDSVLGLAGATGKAPQELASALFAVESAGLRGEQAMGALEIAAKASTAGLGDTRSVALAAAASMTAYQASGMTAAKATDILTATVREGNLSAEQLAGSISRVLPIAAAAGVGLEEVGAAAAIITRSGASAAEAMTQIKASIMSLNAPSKEARNRMEEYGLSVEKVQSTLRNDGLVAALQLLNDATGGNAVAMREILGSSEALTGALTLLGTEAGTLESVFDGVANSTGDTQRAFDAATSTSAFKMTQAFTEIKVALVEVGSVIAPVAATVAGGIADMVSAFTDLPGPIQNVLLLVGALAAAVGPLLMMIGQMSSGIVALKGLAATLGVSFGALAVSILAVTAALAVAVKLWYDSGAAKRRAEERAQSLANALRLEGDAVENVNQALAGYKEWEQVADVSDRIALSIDDVRVAAQDGSDAFQELNDLARLTSGAMYDTAGAVAEANKVVAGMADGPAKDLAQRLVDLYSQGKITTEEFMNLTNMVDESADAFDDNREALQKQGEELAKTRIAVDGALSSIDQYALSQLRSAESMQEADRWLVALRDGMDAYNDKAGITDGWMVQVAQSTDDAAEATENLADQVGMSQEEFDLYVDAVEAAAEAADSFVSGQEVLGRAMEIAEERTRRLAEETAIAAGQSADEWEQFATDATVSLADFNQALEDQIAAMGSYKDNLATIASRLAPEFREPVMSMLQEMGPEAAGLIAEMATASDEEFGRMAENAVARSEQMQRDVLEEIRGLDAAAAVAMHIVGVNMAAGLANGISQNGGAVAGAAGGAVGMGIAAARRAAQVRSPSLVMMEIGRYMAEGLALGIEGGAQRVDAAARFLAEHGIDGVSTAVDDLDGVVANLQQELDDISFQRAVDELGDLSWAVTEAAMSINEIMGSTVLYDAALATAEKRYDSAASRVQDLSWAMEDLAASGRSASEMTLSSEAAVLRSEVAYMRAQDRVAELTKRLGELDKGSAEYALTSKELELAQIGVEQASLGVEDAVRRANTVGEESDRIAREAAIAAGEEEEARRNVAEAAHQQERDLAEAQQKMAEASTRLREHELRMALDWIKSQQERAKAAETSAGGVSSAYGSIPTQVSTTVELRTQDALSKLGSYMSAVNGATAAAESKMAKAAESARLNAAKIAADAAKVLDPFRSTTTANTAVAKTATTTAAKTTIATAARTAVASGRAATTTARAANTVTQFARGGVVPGARGTAVPIVAHGGEVVVPEHVVAAIARGVTPGNGSGSGGGGMAVTINLNGSATMADAQMIVDRLREYNRSRGAIPITVQ